MNQNKIIGIGLALLNLILLLFCIVQYVQADRTAPKFLLEATDIIYVPDMDTTELIQGITANDNRDGDVTERIVIEKITEKKKEKTAVVYYAVSDRSGNVTKISKLFHAQYPESEMSQDEKPIQEKSGQTEASAGDDSSEQTDPEEEAGDEAEGEALDGQDMEDIEQDEDGEQPAAVQPVENNAQSDEIEQPAASESADSANTGAPELVLGSSEITIDAGTNPPWTEIITIMRDDKDNYETLYYNLHVSQFNRNRPGTYPVTVYVEDSDGNRSQEVPFTIIIR